MRYLLLFVFGATLLSCGKSDSPDPPQAVQLVYPEKDSECISGQTVNATTSRVEFRWGKAQNTESYELRVTNLGTNITQTTTVTGLSASLTLEKGMPFSWLVRSRNSKVSQTVSSPTWKFYNAGEQATYAPFPASIIRPNPASKVFPNSAGQVVLEWSASDVEGDITGFQVYFSTSDPPNDLLASPSEGTTTQTVDVVSGNTYYWKVITQDSQGNTSDSGVYVFRVL